MRSTFVVINHICQRIKIIFQLENGVEILFMAIKSSLCFLRNNILFDDIEVTT